MNEADFVNAYIERLITVVHDLTSKNILLETRLAMADKAAASLNNELQALKETGSSKSTKSS